MAYLRESVGSLMGLLPLGWLHRMAGTELIVPLYHAVSDLPLPHIQPLYPIRSTEQFKTDIAWIQSHYKPLSLSGLMEQTLSGKPIRERSFHLTFDDGLRQVLPLSGWLRRQGISATLFVNPGFVGNGNLMHRYKAALLISRLDNENDSQLRAQLAGLFNCNKEVVRDRLFSFTFSDQEILDTALEMGKVDVQQFLENERPYLTKDELQIWLDDGHTLGAHSMDHPEYGQLPEAEQWRQTMESCRWVQAQFGLKPVPFAFPFTDWKIERSFYERWQTEMGENLLFGTRGVHPGFIPQHVQRLPMERTKHAAGAIVKGALVSRWLHRFRKQKL